ncbi:hypothetical protein FGB62_25g638 [Gracilaria domingensis]|nr:hypothetical protein FGB62_25g638 [Gracilaria domingensis]
MYAPDSSVAVVDEEQPLLPPAHPPAPKHIRPLDHEDVDLEKPDPVKEAITRALLSPPFIAVVSAMSCALIAPVGNAFLRESGAMHPFLLSINIVGGVVVPISCMIVGAELYRSLAKITDQVVCATTERGDRHVEAIDARRIRHSDLHCNSARTNGLVAHDCARIVPHAQAVRSGAQPSAGRFRPG